MSPTMPSSTPVPPVVRKRRPHYAPPSQPPQFWRPPPDPEKPLCPYQAGFSVEIKRHTPPRPFGGPQYGSVAWRERSDVDLYSATQTEVVLAYPPLERETTLSSLPAPTAVTLTILSTLAVADGRGAQLVVCSITPNPFPQESSGIVAKIFDPLYYSFEAREAAYVPENVARLADVHYTHEAAALDHLDTMCKAGRTGLAAPKYFGSWTFTLPIVHAGTQRQRSVRLVLMENIKGRSISSVCGDPPALFRYNEQDRLDIFATVLDAIVRQLHAGVDHRDLASRNVILRSSSPPSTGVNQPLPQPVIIDYNVAVVFELSRHGKHPSQLNKLPDNPMKTFWDTAFADFQGWTPSAWDGSPKLCQQWLKERFGGKDASKYAPVSDKLEFSQY
ncbi:hypothetical protein B0I37DRAFT_365995 [Chaetomium sp. MPI-CAGE-AT-0009]|nr:hypothetical protein B0I37DRAFT_365995 [Chaetomium sp. MPI-CAGE-AT-0009]